MTGDWMLWVSLGLNGLLFLALILREAPERESLQAEVFRAHQECREEDERHRLGMSSDRQQAMARWDDTFRASWRERVQDWKAEAERQGLQWLIPIEKGA